MAKITVEDDSKVMDVAKPGKGKIMTTSRPIIAPITSDSPKKDDASATLPDTEVSKPLSPSVTKKIIQPLVPEEVAPEETAEPSATEEPGDSMTDETTVNTPEPAPEEPVEKESTTETETTDAPVTSADSSESSDAASVDAVAGSVGAKKEAIKKAEEQTKRDAAVQELIDSKKYVVPIGHEGPKTRRTGGQHTVLWVMAILVIVTAVAAAYLLIDAGVIETSITLPFDLIK